MNTWQVLQQIKFLLLQRQWEGAALAPDVFQDNSVVVSVLGDEPAMATLIPPTALIQPLSAQSDPMHDEEPDLLMQAVNVRISTTVPGDFLGEYALLGGGRQSQTNSRGRGLLEIEEELFAAIKILEVNNGVLIYSRAKGAAESEINDENRYTALRSYQFELLTTAERFYAPVENFTAVDGAVSTFADISWGLPPARYDTRGVRLLRLAGATAPTTPNQIGATVVLDGSTNPDPGFDGDRPGPGTFSYSIWATYDEWSSGSNERFSDLRSATVVVT